MKLKLTTVFCLMFSVLMFSPMQAMTAFAQDSMKNQTKDDKKKKKKQKRQDVELKAMKGTMTGKGMGSDPNIKEGEELNNPGAAMGQKMTMPIAKGGGTSKGASSDCEVQFDNRTDLNVKTYVNGRYRGAMGGYNDAYMYINPGYITVYARADFTDGTYQSWGPQSYNCSENQYISFRMVN